MEKINRTSKKSENLKQELLSRTWDTIGEESTTALKDDGLKRAIEHKNKLIDFDRTRHNIFNTIHFILLIHYFLVFNFSSAKRTQVIDDESDYFDTNSKWLNQKQRSLLDVSHFLY
jgi:hypothetical protein